MGFKSPKETTCSVDNIGCNKIGMAMGPLLALGFLAGAFIAFGGLLAVIVGGGVPDIKLANPGLQKFIFGAVFPVGLILVVVAGASSSPATPPAASQAAYREGLHGRGSRAY